MIIEDTRFSVGVILGGLMASIQGTIRDNFAISAKNTVKNHISFKYALIRGVLQARIENNKRREIFCNLLYPLIPYSSATGSCDVQKSY